MSDVEYRSSIQTDDAAALSMLATPEPVTTSSASAPPPVIADGVSGMMLMMTNLSIRPQGAEQEKRPWAHMPHVILVLIRARLGISGRIQSSRTCKSWRWSIAWMHCPQPPNSMQIEVDHPPPISYGYPCLFRFQVGNQQCILMDPLRHEDFTIDTPGLPHGPLRIRCSNHGWLLLTHGADRIFFFNPLTRTIVNLPNERYFDQGRRFKFLSPPTSPDCVVFNWFSFDFFRLLYRWRPGDDEWTLFDAYDERRTFSSSSSSSRHVFFKNTIYQLRKDGKVGRYKLWDRTVSPTHGEGLKGTLPDKNRHYMVDMDGELVLVSLDVDGCGVKVHLHKFDDSERRWTELNSIGERLLFVDGFDCTWTKVAAGGGERDKVFFSMFRGLPGMSVPSVSKAWHPVETAACPSLFNEGVCWIELMS